MARARSPASFPHTFWQLFETVLRRGSLTIEHEASDVMRLRDEFYSFQMSLRKARHPDADRFSYVQVWIDKAGSQPTGRVTLQLRDADPRLASIKDALAQTEEYSESEITPRVDPETGDTSALDAALSRLQYGDGETDTDTTTQPPTEEDQ